MIQLIVALIIIVLIFLVVKAINKSNQGAGSKHSNGARGVFGRPNSWPKERLPSALGVPYGHPARTAAERLEASLSDSFESRVKDRVLLRFPRISTEEWDWTWFELKRYFLMCSIMRSVPMYSRQADAVWHEMLMFTREYEQFCTAYCGEMIHHAPHAPNKHPEEGDRALFDWLYGELFEQTPASGRIWGAFYRTSMSAQKLGELERFSEDTLRLQWFNSKAASHYADLNATVEYLIKRSKSQYIAAKNRDRNGIGHDPVLSGTGMLSSMVIFYSISQPDDFIKQMDQQQTVEQRKANGSGGATYGCSGSVDAGRGHSDDSAGGDSSSGGGDSGGSSCGGGCSS